MAWTDDLNIETPEQIDLSLELAGLGSRFVGQLVDWVVKGLILVVLLLLSCLAGALLNYLEFTALAWVAVLILAYFFALGYDVYFEAFRNGQTPGKWLAGTRVVREGGGPVDFRSACIRNLLGIADLLPALYLLGGILVLVNRRRQRLGDLAAGTVVIRERTLEAPADVAEEVRRLASDEFTFTPVHLSTCSPADQGILRSFFVRFHQMQPRPRQALALRLAHILLAKTAYQPTQSIQDSRQAERFLASLYRDLEQWSRHGR
jgi:uncharacterized RDD family membrane protein YckC